MDDDRDHPIPSTSHRVYALLLRRGGTMRIGPLLQECGLDRAQLVAAIKDLNERWCLAITWRKQPDNTDANATRPLTDAERVTLTRLGRKLLWGAHVEE